LVVYTLGITTTQLIIFNPLNKNKRVESNST
jgi:hypothetical protein